MHYIIVPSVGIFSFLALGVSKHIYAFWKLFLRLAYERKFAELKDLLTNEKALSRLSANSANEEKPRYLFYFISFQCPILFLFILFSILALLVFSSFINLLLLQDKGEHSGEQRVHARATRRHS